MISVDLAQNEAASANVCLAGADQSLVEQEQQVLNGYEFYWEYFLFIFYYFPGLSRCWARRREEAASTRCCAWPGAGPAETPPPRTSSRTPTWSIFTLHSLNFIPCSFLFADAEAERVELGGGRPARRSLPRPQRPAPAHRRGTGQFIK